jgi:hypothetical protein
MYLFISQVVKNYGGVAAAIFFKCYIMSIKEKLAKDDGTHLLL